MTASSHERGHLYVESTPTNCVIGGEHGQVTAIVRDLAPRRIPRAAFVHLEVGDMLYVTLGGASGDRDQRREVKAFRRVDRDEFDRLNEIDTLRADMGWRSGPLRPLTPEEMVRDA